MMTGVGVILGTAAYMSPEQAKGREADKRSDIWAFGCVLYEMLTGRRPFDGEDVSETLASILTKEPDWNALQPDTWSRWRRDGKELFYVANGFPNKLLAVDVKTTVRRLKPAYPRDCSIPPHRSSTCRWPLPSIRGIARRPAF